MVVVRTAAISHSVTSVHPHVSSVKSLCLTRMGKNALFVKNTQTHYTKSVLSVTGACWHLKSSLVNIRVLRKPSSLAILGEKQVAKVKLTNYFPNPINNLTIKTALLLMKARLSVKRFLSFFNPVEPLSVLKRILSLAANLKVSLIMNLLVRGVKA